MEVTWLIVIVVVVLIVVVAAMVRKDDPFQAAATELGIKLTRTVPDLLPNLDGMVDGVAVKINATTSRQPTLHYEVFYPALGLGLRLERETTITRTLGQLGSSDPQVGSKPFDDSFRVSTSRPDALQTMMTPQRRRLLIQLLERYPNLVISDGSITLVGDSLEPPPETIVTTTRDLVAAAASLVAGRPPEPATPDPTPQPPAKKQPTAAPSPKDQDAPPPETRPAPETTSEAAAPSPHTPPAVTDAPTGLPPTFFDDAFGDNRLSFEDEGLFERDIRGRTVSMSGKVKKAAEYDGEDELAPDPGAKVVVTVAQIDNDLYGRTDIDAVVYLPGAKPADLNRGDTIRFEGTIERVDSFMRNVFIVGASQKN
jgi:hypothetical protein